MSRQFLSTSDHLDSSSTIVSDTPCTLSAWCKLGSTAGATQYVPITIGESGTGNNFFSIRFNTPVPRTLSADERDATTTSSSATVQVFNALSSSQWCLVTATFTDHSSRSSFLYGGGKGSSSVTRTASGLNSIRVSGDTAATPNFHWRGFISHVAIWNVILTDQQIATLAYLYPNQVAVANLVNYWPLTNNQSPEPDFGSGNLPLTVTGTTFSTDNPNIAGTQVIQLMGQAG